MDIKMTGQTVREFGVERLLVGCPVAIGAFRHIPVFRLVTYGAVDFAVLARGFLPLGVNLGMAGAAGNCRGFLVIGDLRRFMYRMAFGAGRNHLTFIVRLMTVETGWFVAMGSVALLATEFRVFARELDELPVGNCMTGRAGIQQPGVHGYLLRSMGIGMAAETVGYRFSVGFYVAGRTLGHDLFPAPFLGIIGMERRVALLAVKAVTDSVVLETGKDAGMTLSALGHGKRLRFGRINFRCRRDDDRCDLFPFACRRQHRQDQHC